MYRHDLVGGYLQKSVSIALCIMNIVEVSCQNSQILTEIPQHTANAQVNTTGLVGSKDI